MVMLIGRNERMRTFKNVKSNRKTKKESIDLESEVEIDTHTLSV